MFSIEHTQPSTLLPAIVGAFRGPYETYFRTEHRSYRGSDHHYLPYSSEYTADAVSFRLPDM